MPTPNTTPTPQAAPVSAERLAQIRRHHALATANKPPAWQPDPLEPLRTPLEKHDQDFYVEDAGDLLAQLDHERHQTREVLRGLLVPEATEPPYNLGEQQERRRNNNRIRTAAAALGLGEL